VFLATIIQMYYYCTINIKIVLHCKQEVKEDQIMDTKSKELENRVTKSDDIKTTKTDDEDEEDMYSTEAEKALEGCHAIESLEPCNILGHLFLLFFSIS